MPTCTCLTKEWNNDRARCKAAGVRKEVRFQTLYEQALEMLDEKVRLMPHAWIAGDDEMGKNASSNGKFYVIRRSERSSGESV